MIEVVAAGPSTTVQDLGRPGHAHLGVPPSGALDRPAAELANRLVGNSADAAVLETTLSGPTLRLDGSPLRWIALTGAAASLRVGGRPVPLFAPVAVRAGQLVEVGAAVTGLRSYLAVSGGVDVAAVLGSRSTDLLGGLGPPVLRDGDHLPLGSPTNAPFVDVAPAPTPGSVLRVIPGPRADRLVDGALASLTSGVWTVSPRSNRIGVRLLGEPLAWAVPDELPSEGLVTGSVQVPPNGQPVVFLADHPVTGGYPVLAVLREASLPSAAQLRPGASVRFVV